MREIDDRMIAEQGTVVTKQSMQRRSLAGIYSDSFKSQTRSVASAGMTSRHRWEVNARVYMLKHWWAGPEWRRLGLRTWGSERWGDRVPDRHLPYHHLRKQSGCLRYQCTAMCPSSHSLEQAACQPKSEHSWSVECCSGLHRARSKIRWHRTSRIHPWARRPWSGSSTRTQTAWSHYPHSWSRSSCIRSMN